MLPIYIRNATIQTSYILREAQPERLTSWQVRDTFDISDKNYYIRDKIEIDEESQKIVKTSITYSEWENYTDSPTTVTSYTVNDETIDIVTTNRMYDLTATYVNSLE